MFVGGFGVECRVLRSFPFGRQRVRALVSIKPLEYTTLGTVDIKHDIILDEIGIKLFHLRILFLIRGKLTRPHETKFAPNC